MNELPIESVCQFCARCGAKNGHPGEVPFRCSACGFANFFGPVAAVGALVTDQADRLLLVRRARSPGKGKWGLPGGFVDRFETAEVAVAREVREETNLQVIELDFLISAPNQYSYQGVVAPVIDLFFCCQVAEGEIQLVDGELDQFQWVHPREEHLREMAFESNRQAVRAWLQGQDPGGC